MQNTAYEMRISDWSSDVCSSDLCTQLDIRPRGIRQHLRIAAGNLHRTGFRVAGMNQPKARFAGVPQAHIAGNHLRHHQPSAKAARSEEHTSELQSLMRNSYDVFCLKKNKKT